MFRWSRRVGAWNSFCGLNQSFPSGLFEVFSARIVCVAWALSSKQWLRRNWDKDKLELVSSSMIEKKSCCKTELIHLGDKTEIDFIFPDLVFRKSCFSKTHPAAPAGCCCSWDDINYTWASGPSPLPPWDPWFRRGLQPPKRVARGINCFFWWCFQVCYLKHLKVKLKHLRGISHTEKI